MIFITKGSAPMTAVQLNNRTQSYINRDWPLARREQSIRLEDGKFGQYMIKVSLDDDVNQRLNQFNFKLDAYRKAKARLSQYVLSEGRAEKVEDVPTDERVYSEETEEYEVITEPVVVVTAIDPLPLTVEITSLNEEGIEETSVIDNPLVAADIKERQKAQYLIDNTPQEVLDWVDAP